MCLLYHTFLEWPKNGSTTLYHSSLVYGGGGSSVMIPGRDPSDRAYTFFIWSFEYTGHRKTLTWWNCGTSFWGCCIFAFAAWFAVNRAWCAAKHCWLRMYELGKCTNKINSLLKYHHKLSVLLPWSPNKITWKLSMYVCISRAQLTTKMNKLG